MVDAPPVGKNLRRRMAAVDLVEGGRSMAMKQWPVVSGQ